ncbi:MAG: lipopolysaccharide transport periplasmic protein LptA [Gammaproteobacteria bacterium]
MLISLVLLGATSCLAESIAIQPDMPITLDADSSDFDYESSRLVFRGLRMSQGTLGVRADLAETAKLDFDDGIWVFTGNVEMESDSTILKCDEAKLHFKNHGLQHAELRGGPATFEQMDAETQEKAEGQAGFIEYDLLTGKVKLSEEARFSDGANEIYGENISYDVRARNITANSGDSGPVKILIEPPKQTQE